MFEHARTLCAARWGPEIITAPDFWLRYYCLLAEKRDRERSLENVFKKALIEVLNAFFRSDGG